MSAQIKCYFVNPLPDFSPKRFRLNNCERAPIRFDRDEPSGTGTFLYVPFIPMPHMNAEEYLQALRVIFK